MDNIEKLLKEIKEDITIWRDRKGGSVYFSNSLLKRVGDIFEKGGFGEAKVYLMNQVGRDKLAAVKLLQVLKKFENTPEIIAKRALGRAIITSLIELKKMEV